MKTVHQTILIGLTDRVYKASGGVHTTEVLAGNQREPRWKLHSSKDLGRVYALGELPVGKPVEQK